MSIINLISTAPPQPGLSNPCFWLAGCKAASQSEARFENPCQLTWILTWILFCYINRMPFPNTSTPRQNGCHFADNICILIFLYVIVPKGPINSRPALGFTSDNGLLPDWHIINWCKMASIFLGLNTEVLCTSSINNLQLPLWHKHRKYFPLVLVNYFYFLSTEVVNHNHT